MRFCKIYIYIFFPWIFHEVTYSEVKKEGKNSFAILLYPGLLFLPYSYGGLLICIRNIHFSLFALVWQAVMFCL